MATERPQFGDSLSHEHAVALLQRWRLAETSHGILYHTAEHDVLLAVRAKIENVSDAIAVCKGLGAELHVALIEARFAFGPIARLEYPHFEESSKSGLHILSRSRGWVFVSEGRELPPINPRVLG